MSNSMKLRCIQLFLLASSIMLPLTGCMLGPKFEVPPVLTEQEWREVSAPRFTGRPADDVEWWKNLNDPVLNQLIQEAHSNNPTLHIAGLRIIQARIGRSASVFTQFPLITGAASYSHVDMSTNVKPEVEITKPKKSGNDRSRRESDRRLGDRFREALGAKADELGPALRDSMAANLPSVSVTPELDVYDVSFDAIWELDIWGEKRQRVKANNRELEAAYARYDDIMVILTGEVARTYIDLRTYDRRIASLRTVLKRMDDFVGMTEQRFKTGEALVTDVKLAQLLAGIVRSSLPPLMSARRQAENGLCVLLGKGPRDLTELLGDGGEIPQAPLAAPVGIPADLLRRRPDVRMAEHLAAAECARIGMAKALILPSFSIFGSLGLSASEYDDLLDSGSEKGAYGAAMKITNLINYPVTVLNVRLKDAQFQEALLYYQSTVLRANAEVENTMYAYLMSRDEVNILQENVTAANETADLTMAAYQQGKVMVSVPLFALTFLASQEDKYWEWQGNVVTDYVAIYKALGGGWQTRTQKELVPEYIREQMKKDADWWSFTGRNDLKTQQLRTTAVAPR